ncbi:SRPBCC family protein [Nocardioides euryhalodurans]|nr:SRPBCC family protein [Nocardioides euryhalodurans]
MDKFKDAGRNALGALGKKALGTVSDRVGGLTEKFDGVAGGGPVGKAVAEGGKAKAEGGSAVGGALKGAASGVKDKLTGGGESSGGGKPTKSTNIVETIDVGVPIKVAYNQWTEFGSFPSFMKKVESVQAPEENKLEFSAKIFWSQRSWEATIQSQIPDERIVWRSKGQKGHVDGAVTFHEIGPNLTRILVVLEYYPKGFFEKTGNIWEAQGRRARAELRHFRRHVMTRTLLEPDEVEGWRGTIEDGEVVESHEDAVEREEQEEAEAAEQEDGGGEYDESDESDEPEGEDEYEEDEEAAEGEEPEDEYEDADEAEEYDDAEAEEEPEAEEYEEPEGDEPEDEYEDAESEEEPESEEETEEYEEEPEAEEAEDEYAPEEEPEEQEEEKPRRKRRAR